MMTFESDVDTGVIELIVDGGVTKAEYDAAVAAMEVRIFPLAELEAARAWIRAG